MSEIGSITSGLQAIQLNTQLNINTEIIKKAIETEQQIAQLLDNLSRSGSQLSSSGVDIYV
ncbi:MAG: hypothetical protein N2738_02195 [Thermodesulfovibrionales bacterium]|nr:hypothetical protein [Thermodesulfovibrionales bacterium]